MPLPSTCYRILVFYDEPGVRDPGMSFGDFSAVERAEECLIAVSIRPDVRSAKLEIIEGGD